MSFSHVLNLTVFQRSLVNNFLKVYGYSKNMCSVQMPPWTNLMFKSPTLELQEYLDISILKEKCFEPTPESMKTALELFIPKRNHVIDRVSSTLNPEKFPSHNMPEIALVGQSNSGKSSLLKAMFLHAPELRIQSSKNPGHTKALTFYQVGSRFCLVDMPGYGYRQQKLFETSVVDYLKYRKNLVKTFLIIDCQEGYNSWDDAAVQMVNDMKIPFAIILTKVDIIPDSQRLKTFLHVKSMIVSKEKNCFPQIFMLSSLTYEGLAYLITFVAHITGNLNIEKSS